MDQGIKREAGGLDGSVQAKKVRKEDMMEIGELKKECIHEVGLPDGYEENQIHLDPEVHGTVSKPLFKGKMAKGFPFELDPFQKLAISCLERRESVLVAAHTSAGKTAVAEYATAMAFRDNQRVLYTSPLKALSNQKFRDFSTMFSDTGGSECVGLMTGENTINPMANFIVMTTEILRSMLYRGSEVLREVMWIVFDEVHYMKDRERGVVWEEAIILLPPEVRMVFLSATLPNSREFADWIASLHSQPCHVIGTDYRPTPLKHYGYPIGGDGLYHLKDGDGEFLAERFEEMVTQLKQEEAASFDHPRRIQELPDGRWKKTHAPDDPKEGKKDTKSDAKHLHDIVQVCRDNNFLPCIAFCFVKREAEANARLLSKIPFNNEDEKQEVRKIFDMAMDGLSEEDRDLPAIHYTRPLLENGIGTHHSGLLPIIKEITEILFQEGLVKVLCATETFAMGLNMPARTVIFTSVFKFDGIVTRQLTSGEYIQMSGRAGRRDVDDRGYVIMMINQELKEEDCRKMMSGGSDTLKSSFRLTYYTLLNLLRRVEGTQQSMGDIIRKSFQEFQHERKVPIILKQIQELENQAAQIKSQVPNTQLMEYRKKEDLIAKLRASMMEKGRESDMFLSFLRPGRLIRVKENWGWGVVVAVVAQWGGKGGKASKKKYYLVDTLLPCERGTKSGSSNPPKAAGLDAGKYTMAVIPVPLSVIDDVSTLWISLPDDLRSEHQRTSVLSSLCTLYAAYSNSFPTVNVLNDMHLKDPEVVSMEKELESLLAAQQNSPIHGILQETDALQGVTEKVKLLVEADKLHDEIQQSFYSNFCEEAKARTAVLKRLGHLNDEDVVTLKGKVACEIDTADELLCTELLFDGVFDDLDVHSSIALASVLLQMGEKSSEKIELIEKLSIPLGKLYKTAEMIADVSIECKQVIVKDDYLESFKTVLMDVMYAWSRGEKFKVVCEMTDLYEGFIVRSARRLEELLNQLVQCAKVMGNEHLSEKFQQGITSIRRDIMFAASLYV